MKVKIVKAIALILAMICILCYPVPASAVSQGTDGTELQVMKPQNLEIHLGEAWAGVEFELTTDAGKYPGTIPVGEDGILRLEIGGSENYILSCLDSIVENPRTDNALPEGEGTAPVAETIEDTLPTVTISEEAEDAAVAGIPVKHMVMFGGGLVLAICVLSGIHYAQKPNGRNGYPDDEDEI